jgi:hypothetical protein
MPPPQVLPFPRLLARCPDLGVGAIETWSYCSALDRTSIYRPGLFLSALDTPLAFSSRCVFEQQSGRCCSWPDLSRISWLAAGGSPRCRGCLDPCAICPWLPGTSQRHEALSKPGRIMETKRQSFRPRCRQADRHARFLGFQCVP